MGNDDKNKGAQEPDLNQILKNKREKLANLQAAGKDPFVITKYDQTHHTADAKASYEDLEEKLLADHVSPAIDDSLPEEEKRAIAKEDYEKKRAVMDASPINVSIAGRIMLKRVMGKASFINVKDLKGDCQVYVSRVISSALKAICSGLRWARFRSTLLRSFFYRRTFSLFPRSSTDLQIPICVTVRDTLTLS